MVGLVRKGPCFIAERSKAICLEFFVLRQKAVPTAIMLIAGA